jgi:hypothetical protein
MKSPAKLISYFLHPIFMPTWLLIFLLFFADKSLLLMQPGKKAILLVTFSLFMTILPLLNIMILKYMGFISGYEMDDKKERKLPFFICLVYYAGLFYLLYGSEIPVFYTAFVGSGFFLILFNFIINIKWKISSHGIGAGGFTGSLLSFALWNAQRTSDNTAVLLLFALSFSISGLILTSRLVLEKHSLTQVYSGYITGILLTLILVPAIILTLLHFYFR